MSEYITRSPARNPRIVETMNVIVTPMATVTPVDRVAAVGAVEDWHWIEYTEVLNLWRLYIKTSHIFSRAVIHLDYIGSQHAKSADQIPGIPPFSL